MTAKEFNDFYSELEEKVKSEKVEKLLSDSTPIHIIQQYVIVKPRDMYMVIDMDNMKDVNAFEKEMQAVDYCLDRYDFNN